MRESRAERTWGRSISFRERLPLSEASAARASRKTTQAGRDSPKMFHSAGRAWELSGSPEKAPNQKSAITVLESVGTEAAHWPKQRRQLAPRRNAESRIIRNCALCVFACNMWAKAERKREAAIKWNKRVVWLVVIWLVCRGAVRRGMVHGPLISKHRSWGPAALYMAVRL